jgi:acetolactate synthase-1/2/3 large subunit
MGDRGVSRTVVADVIVDGIIRAGTRRIFGVATGRAGDPLLETARANGLSVTLAARAPGACVMAAVTGDLTDAPGAAVIGEGAAFSGPPRVPDGAPFVLITTDHPLLMPRCKETLAVESESAAHRIAHAVRLAMTEPRGAVHLDIPARVVGAAALPVATSCRPDPPPYPDLAALDDAARAISDASRPLLLAGFHCRSHDAAMWLRALVEALPAPLLTTVLAKGTLPDPHPLMLGVLGLAGVEQRLLARADLVVALGLAAFEAVPASYWSTKHSLFLGPATPPDGHAFGPRVLGAVGTIVEELAVRLRDKRRADWDVAEVDRLRREGATPSGGAGLDARLVRLAREATPAGTIATVDSPGYFPRVAAAWPATAPREFLSSSGLDAPGFALPAAIAAWLLRPERHVVCFTDPSQLSSAASELETAARLGARVAIVVFAGDGVDAAALTRRAADVGLAVSDTDSEMTFAWVFARALATPGSSLILARG